MSELSEKRLMRELEKMEKSPNTQFTAFPNPKNIFEWHFLLYNIDDSPYAGGQFHGKILIPREYPLKPPSIIFVTPQGRFKCGEKICLSFTNYHPETWSTSWTIQAMLVGLISFMHTDENTLGGLNLPVQQKLYLARHSATFNYNNPEFMEIFKDRLEEIKKVVKEPAQQNQVPPNLQIQDALVLNASNEQNQQGVIHGDEPGINRQQQMLQQKILIQNYQEFVEQDDELRLNRQEQRRNKQKMLMYLLGTILIVACIILINQN